MGWNLEMLHASSTAELRLLAQDFGRVLIIVSLHEDHLNVWTTQPCSRLHGGLENAGHQLSVHLQLTNPHV
jgi:hypothetical protein